MTNQVNLEAFEKWYQSKIDEANANNDMDMRHELHRNKSRYEYGYQASTQAREREIEELEKKYLQISNYFEQINIELQADNIRMREALKHADEFITNGIEFGFIRMPDDDLKGIDSAHDTPEIVRKTLSSTPTQSLAEDSK